MVTQQERDQWDAGKFLTLINASFLNAYYVGLSMKQNELGRVLTDKEKSAVEEAVFDDFERISSRIVKLCKD